METGFIVHRADGTNRVFKPYQKGLLFSEVKYDIILIKTVDSIKN